MTRVIADASLVLVLLQILRCSCAKSPLWANPVNQRLPNRFDTLREQRYGFREVACCSALPNADASELLVDMPNPTAFCETRRLFTVKGLFKCAVRDLEFGRWPTALYT